MASGAFDPAADLPIVLASSSPYRKRLLEQLQLNFLAVSPEIDEAAVQNDSRLTPTEVAVQLAERKARAVAERYPQHIVIGSDQVACLQDRVLTKPGSAENNRKQLAQLAGQTHQLITAVCVIAGQQVYPLLNVSRLTMRSLTSEEIARYVAADQPWDCAGGYRWESLGISLFERIETSDHTAILGLPLLELVSLLRALGTIGSRI